MGTTYRFISTEDEAKLVLAWFKGLSNPPVEQLAKDSVLLYFKHLGDVLEQVKLSPLVNVFLPHKTHGVLTTAGEVHFLPTPLSRFPELAAMNRKFKKWLSQYTLLHSFKSDHVDIYDYYLEGSLRNWDSDIYALPGGLKALENGEYFVSEDDSARVLDTLCRQLELRGVTGIDYPQPATDN